MNEKVSWLHISDLHIGGPDFEEYWSGIEGAFYSDLCQVVRTSGQEIDLVIFSGDLTQNGSKSQFDELELFLIRMWGELTKINPKGRAPVLVAVPGNHDLSRPTPEQLEEESIAILRSGWDDRTRKSFWKNRASKSRAKVLEMFSNYQNWWRGTSIPKLGCREGLLPGDASATLLKGNIKIGILGLNSAFLHFYDVEESDGLLDLSINQFNAACDGNGARWAESHHFCILVTHHPLSWLRQRGKSFISEVCNGPERFQFHLFGHMHNHAHSEVSAGWDDPLVSLQASSLFSRLPLKNGAFTRHAGYSYGVIRRRGSQYEYTVSPRQWEIHESNRSRFSRLPGIPYRRDGSEFTGWRAVPVQARISAAASRFIDITDTFGEIAAFAGPRGYGEVHRTLENWMRLHAANGPVHVRNIAFDMQYTWPFMETLFREHSCAPICWETLFIDHTSELLRQALAHDKKILMETAAQSEKRIRNHLRESSARPGQEMIFAARAYSAVPAMHGFLVNDELLIVGFCINMDCRIETTEYMIFVKDGGSMNCNERVFLETKKMFLRWFDAQWTEAREIGPVDSDEHQL